jgi:hypothetical protein
MEAKITAFIDSLIVHDYILFGSVFALFILLVILGIVLRRKTTLAVFLIFLSFSLLILGPTLGYIKMHEYLFKNSTVLTSQKRLEFTQAIVVKGSVTNESKFDFESCKITAAAHKHTENSIKNYLFQFKAIKKMSILEHDIKKGEIRDFKIIIEPFTYSKDYNISIKADCK